jgi:hypothetical protein
MSKNADGLKLSPVIKAKCKNKVMKHIFEMREKI